jgi:hypothetical protein
MVAINVGQVWETIGDQLAEVIQYDADAPDFPWIVEIEGQGWVWGRDGRCAAQQDKSAKAFVAVVRSAPLDDPNTKATNPKEAIGDKKVPLWLCSAIAMAHWAAGQFAGLIKYGAWNWRAAGVRTSTYLSAIARHLGRYANGERCDPVDGTHHLGNIMACCAILLEAEAIGKLNDDRSPTADLQKTFDEVEAIVARLKLQYADKAPKHWTINEIPS